MILCNRYYAWYQDCGQTQLISLQLEGELRNWFDKFHKPVIQSEYGADTVAGLHMVRNNNHVPQNKRAWSDLTQWSKQHNLAKHKIQCNVFSPRTETQMMEQRSKDFFFASLGSSSRFTRANAHWGLWAIFHPTVNSLFQKIKWIRFFRSAACKKGVIFSCFSGKRVSSEEG